MATAKAQHILVETEDQCNELIIKIQNGEDFAELAKEHSKCPSGQNGGDLGEFSQGMMVPEFDAVIFNQDNNAGELYDKPVKTQFGYHVIRINERSQD